MRQPQGLRPTLGRQLHKLTLYLIVLQPLLLLLYAWRAPYMRLGEFALASLLLLGYQWAMGRLLFLQARRSNDGYLVYPVVGAALLLALLVMLAALNQRF
ncbi:hypothetical protein Q9290_08720 [Oceanimonas sp. CHS3-5]|uniref:hypothetical protein n=1 Tax=Oceanimonas sp. CHS3-5 TaxID=3068186 RepID=UPI00273E4679|nr:hypothetical protein [Oceanimonas sp. CHS3-5]MDP5292368.1 hypothetical protein [Oceanimonas sp. CHS3-5]